MLSSSNTEAHIHDVPGKDVYVTTSACPHRFYISIWAYHTNSMGTDAADRAEQEMKWGQQCVSTERADWALLY